MAAIPVGNPVLEDGPCGAALRRAANSGLRRAATGLLSACRAPVTAVGRQRGHSEPKNHVKTTGCAVTRAMQGGVPPFAFTDDNRCYRPQSCQSRSLSPAPLIHGRPVRRHSGPTQSCARRLFEKAWLKMCAWASSARASSATAALGKLRLGAAPRAGAGLALVLPWRFRSRICAIMPSA